MGTAQVQGKLWGAAAADWAALAEPVQIPFFTAALDAIGIERGTRLLDAGCGAGLALTLAAQRGAIVTGLDASGELLRIARERLPEADLREGELEALPYADDSFDAVTAFNSIQYAGDPTAALRELKRVARPGVRVAVTTWGRPEQCEMRALLAAIERCSRRRRPVPAARSRWPRRGHWRHSSKARGSPPSAPSTSRLPTRTATSTPQCGRISRPALRAARSRRRASRRRRTRSSRSASRPGARTGRSASTTSSRC